MLKIFLMFTVLFYMFHFMNSRARFFIFVAGWKIGKNDGGFIAPQLNVVFFIPSAHAWCLVIQHTPFSTSMAGSSSFMTMTSSVSFMAFIAMMSFSFFVMFSAFPACSAFFTASDKFNASTAFSFWVQ